MAPVDQQNAKEIQPIKTLEELLDWKKPTYHIDEIVFGKELHPRSPPCKPEQLKTLICHDMKGGYLDDRFYSGSSNKDAYRFYHWSGVDMFVYFSHNLVTIPPPCWISAAHLHGVKVLGTFITEWDAGADICRKLLSDEESINKAVSQLVEIAKYHRFEGWLINIENAIDSDKVDMLVDFVQKLTAAMRSLCPESVVIWYDSVTKEGKLEWQNELNDLNRSFFDACDGIFLNYTWTNEHLCRSQEAAGKRNSDVYVGLDVFGRNFYEGGKFNTHKAMELARANNLSVAIFAQGWTYETQENFEEAEDKLWQSLSPYLIHHGPKCIPFKTSFCQGIGEKKFMRGECRETSAWYNLCEQQYQPIWSHEEGIKMRMVMNEAYDGGGCLQLSTSDSATVRLIVCEIQWEKALLVSVMYKWCKSPVPLSFVLHVEPASQDKKLTSEQRLINLECEGKTKDAAASDTFESQTLAAEKVVDSEVEGWTIKTFQIPEDGIALNQFDVKIQGASTILLGNVHIYNICCKGLQK